VKKLHLINTIEKFGPNLPLINGSVYVALENRLYRVNEKFELELIEEFSFDVRLIYANSEILRLKSSFNLINFNGDGFDIVDFKFKRMLIIHNDVDFVICSHLIDDFFYISKVSVDGFVYWTKPINADGFIRLIKINDDVFVISMFRLCTTVTAYRFEDGSKIWETDLLEIDPNISIDDFFSHSWELFDRKVFIQLSSSYFTGLVSLDVERGQPTIIDGIFGTLKVFNNRLYRVSGFSKLFEITMGASTFKTYDFSNLAQTERVVPHGDRFDFYKNDTSQYFVFVNSESARCHQVCFVDMEKNELVHLEKTSKRYRKENGLMNIKVHDKYVYLLNGALSLLIYKIED
jgi:hypothetical protein